MKKSISISLAIVLMAALLLSGCGQNAQQPAENSQEKPNETVKEEPLKIALLINGTLGDKSFYDSAANGMDLIKKEFGDKVETKVIEMSFDSTKWEPTLLDVSEQDWDIIISGTGQMKELVAKIAPQYPDKKYIMFGTTMDFSKGDLSNVYCVEYKQNEGSFLAGALAAMVTTSDLPYANKDKIIGFLGGTDIPVINDFLVGYIQGAQYVDKDVKVAISFIGNYDDSAKGKEMALAQYNQGADIGYNVAGQAGLGQLDAAMEKNRYAIGVDSDQAEQIAEMDPKKADYIVTSVLKRVDNSLLRAVKMHIDGTLKYGSGEVLGIQDGAMGLAKNAYYEKLIPEEMRNKIEEIESKVVSGEIKVDTAYGMSTEELDQRRNSVKP